jgi:Tol biopolymer transport system component/DNA-binding winged helix-turn-helix (wHTH) protein
MALNGSGRVRFGAYEADLHTCELWKHGSRVKLGGQPFEILAVLVRRPGQLVTREELRAQLWPRDTFVDFNHGLNAAVNKLRDALCDSADTPKYIETLPRRGYRFVAPVESVTPPATGEAIEVEEKRFDPITQPALIEAQPAALAGEGLVAPVAVQPLAETGTRTQRPKRWLAYLAAGVVTAASVWIVANWLRLRAVPNETAAAEIEVPIKMSPLTTLHDRTSQPAFSPDGNRVAFRREGSVPGSSGIWIKEVGGEELIQLSSNSTDCCPAWSPDGQSLAFSRLADQRRAIIEVPAVGGPLREVFATDLLPEHGELDWSPDGHTLAYVARGTLGSSAVFLLSLETRTARQLTTPTALDQDWGPRFSPDGSRIAFVRVRNIMVMTPEGGEVLRLTRESSRVMGPPAWTPDGQAIVFASIDGEGPSLRKIPISGGATTRIREAGNFAWSPAISKTGFRLATEMLSSARTIEREDIDPPGQETQALVTTLSGENSAPHLSPDGRKLAFQSDRAGGMDIWVSDQDGQNPIQMTAVGTARAPRWSPDGKEIVFDTSPGQNSERGPGAVFLVKPGEATPRRLVQDGFSNHSPRWSRDGNWIYFASNRSGDWQVWKIQEWGGSLVQVTRQGGFAAEESPDGQFLYYVKRSRESPEVWRMPLGGGPESLVRPAVRPLDWAAWAMVEKGIVFVESGANGEPTVSFYDFSTETVRRLAVLDKPPFWITATQDGRSVIFDHPGQQEGHVMLLENFR